MCLLAFAWRAHPTYPLVLVANRDEFFARPTEPAHWWPQRGLLAGRDKQAGGTWLGVSASGRFAALTNFRQAGGTAPAPHARSRGALVTDYLDGTAATQFSAALAATAEAYAGFNLIYTDLATAAAEGELRYVSNRTTHAAADGTGATRSCVLAAGVHGLSNGPLGATWPKTDFATAALRAALSQPTLEIDPLLDLLDHREPAPDASLPDTGIGLERERLLSAPFIVSPVYGTRCTTALLLDRNGEVAFAERSFDAAGQPAGERRFRWRLGSAAPWRRAAGGEFA